MDDKEKLQFQIPDANNMPCRYCKYNCIGTLEEVCKAFNGPKPKSVYFENKPCPKFEV